MRGQQTVRVKVSRDSLLARVRAAKETAQAQHKARTLEFAAERKAVRALTVAALSDALKAARRGELPRLGTEFYGGEYHPVAYVDVPKEARCEDPGEFDPASYDKDIALLEIAAEDSFTLTTDDHFSRYLA